MNKTSIESRMTINGLNIQRPDENEQDMKINKLIWDKDSDLNCQLEARNPHYDIDLLSPNNFLILSQKGIQNQEQSDSQFKRSGSYTSLQYAFSKQEDDLSDKGKTQTFKYSSFKTIKHTTQNKTYQTLMIYFNIKKFVENLTETIRQTYKLSEPQLLLIADISTNKLQSRLIINFSQAILNQQKYHKSDRKPNIVNMMKLISANQSSKNFKIQQSLGSNIRNKINKLVQSWIKYAKIIIQKIPLTEPDSKYKITWNIFTALVRTYFIYWIPIEITYKPLFLFGDGVAITVALLIILIIDVLIRLNTVYYQNGQAVRARWEILTLQLKNTLLEDTLSYLPLIMYTIIGYSQITQTIQFVHLLFFYQFKYIGKVFNQVEDQLYLMNNITKLISLLLYILHLFSCFQFFIANHMDQQQNWIIYRNIQDKYWFSQYVDSFYYSTVTMLTIGYGDIVPQNDYEKLIAIFFMLFSCIWLSYCVNTVGTILQSMSQNQIETKQKMVKINKYMEQRNISYSLQYKIKQYLNYRWKQETAEDITEQKNIIEQLSNELKDELFQETVSIMIDSCPLFSQQFSTQFKKTLIPHIQERIIEPDTIFNNDFNGINLLIVEQGQIEIYTGPQRKLQNNDLLSNRPNYMSKGQSIGVVEFLSDQITKENYRAIGFVTLLSIDKTIFLKLLKDFPGDYENYFQLRDSYIYQTNNPLQIKKYCASCNSSNHDVIFCPKVHLIINREVTIKKQTFPLKQQRNFEFIRKPQKFNFQSKKDKQIIEEYSQIFQEDNKGLLESQLQNQLEYINSSDSDKGEGIAEKKKYYKNIKKNFQRNHKKITTEFFNMDLEQNEQSSNSDRKELKRQSQAYTINVFKEENFLNNNQSSQMEFQEFSAPQDYEKDEDKFKDSQHQLSLSPKKINRESIIFLPIDDPKKRFLKRQPTNEMHQIEEKLQKRKFQRQQSRQNSKLIVKGVDSQKQEELFNFSECIKKFNEEQCRNVEKLYQKLEQKQYQVPLDIFLLYKQLEKKERWDGDMLEYEEQMKNFKKYMVEFNSEQVLAQLEQYQKGQQRYDYEIFERLMPYLIYPWIFIKKYLKNDSMIQDKVLEKTNDQKELKQRKLRNRLKQKSMSKFRKAINLVKTKNILQKRVYPETQIPNAI